jgi:proline dehydrogenase
MSLTRRALLWASTNAWLRDRAMRTGFVRRSVSRFMPGERVDDALVAARELSGASINTIFTRLGENITAIGEADEVAAHYREVLERIEQSGLDIEISIKPTQLGFDQDPEVCFRHCLDLVERTAKAGSFFWLDMESTPYVDGTLALYKRLRAHSDKVGVAIQTYLYRSAKDIEDLIPLGPAIRLVKGAYLEPPSLAYPKKADVDENFYRLSARLLEDDNTRPGALLHIGTHDIPLQDRLLKLIADRRVSSDRYEIAMLFGIQATRQRELASSGVPTRCLVSYGQYWFPWYMRRLAERPANIGFVVRNMFR